MDVFVAALIKHSHRTPLRPRSGAIRAAHVAISRCAVPRGRGVGRPCPGSSPPSPQFSEPGRGAFFREGRPKSAPFLSLHARAARASSIFLSRGDSSSKREDNPTLCAGPWPIGKLIVDNMCISCTMPDRERDVSFCCSLLTDAACAPMHGHLCGSPKFEDNLPKRNTTRETLLRSISETHIWMNAYIGT